ncbi:response regulator [Natrarchaeobius chitinivorans]|uniref:Response regulator n=1 Tax=Natrarchaeobius chitinivorans TaxID=1679083 RepID=A0A3N6MG52_NATCH|nr:response regulator [Natrarchaeobius chitinivorans]RQG94591.1 response regulator [Natrarchaeobius chitinivorans]
MADCNDDASRHRTILLVEDNPGDARLVEEICDDLNLSSVLHTVSTGSEALDFVNQRGEHSDVPPTDLVILDWHLSGLSAKEVVSELNDDPAHAHIPVIVVTGTVTEKQVREVYELNVNACLPRPDGPDELRTTIRAFKTFWLSTARLPYGNCENRR